AIFAIVIESSATRSLFSYVTKTSPDQTLPPDRVVAVMIALEAFWYSALKFWVSTRYSWIAFRGKGFPRLASWPATPLALLPVRSFFRLAPSTNTLTDPGPCAPPVKVLGVVVLPPRFTKSGLTDTPGASAARSIKLRLAVGSAWIC